jgi:hypothetical protein
VCLSYDIALACAEAPCDLGPPALTRTLNVSVLARIYLLQLKSYRWTQTVHADLSGAQQLSVEFSDKGLHDVHAVRMRVRVR